MTAVINRAKNRDLSDKPRLAVTPALMTELKDRLKEDRMPVYDKRLFWCVACLTFWGSLRVHEILTVKTNEFTPDRTMLIYVQMDFVLFLMISYI